MLTSDYKIMTQRLNLRCFTLNDCADMLELRKDPENNPFDPDDIWTGIEDAREFIDFASLFYDDNPDKPGWFRYFFAVRETNNEKVIGYCGIGAPDFDRSLTEVFYGLAKNKWGCGYATEAANAMLELAFTKMGLTRVIGFINPDNIASRKVLQKIGMTEIGILDNISEEHNFYGDALFEIKRDEWFRLHDQENIF